MLVVDGGDEDYIVKAGFYDEYEPLYQMIFCLNFDLLLWFRNSIELFLST